MNDLGEVLVGPQIIWMTKDRVSLPGQLHHQYQLVGSWNILLALPSLSCFFLSSSTSFSKLILINFTENVGKRTMNKDLYFRQQWQKRCSLTAQKGKKCTNSEEKEQTFCYGGPVKSVATFIACYANEHFQSFRRFSKWCCVCVKYLLYQFTYEETIKEQSFCPRLYS